MRSTSAPTVELLTNGGFEIGNFSSWIYCNPAGATFPGTLKKTSDNFVAHSQLYSAQAGNYFYLDGAVGSDDYLSQIFPTNIGSTYNISFWLFNHGVGTNNDVNIILST